MSFRTSFALLRNRLVLTKDNVRALKTNVAVIIAMTLPGGCFGERKKKLVPKIGLTPSPGKQKCPYHCLWGI